MPVRIAIDTLTLSIFGCLRSNNNYFTVHRIGSSSYILFTEKPVHKDMKQLQFLIKAATRSASRLEVFLNDEKLKKLLSYAVYK